MTKAKVYGVVNGKDSFVGIVEKWAECKALVKGVNADFRKFEAETLEEAKAQAQAWIDSADTCDGCGRVRILTHVDDPNDSKSIRLCYSCLQSAKAKEANEAAEEASSTEDPTEIQSEAADKKAEVTEKKEEVPMTIEEIKARQKELMSLIRETRQAQAMEQVAALAREFNQLTKLQVELERSARQAHRTERQITVRETVPAPVHGRSLARMVVEMKAAYKAGNNKKAEALRRSINARLRKGEHLRATEVEAR